MSYVVYERAEPTRLRRLETTSQTVEIEVGPGRKIVLDEILADGPKYADIYVGNRCVMRVPLRINDCVFTPKPGEYSPSYGVLNFTREFIDPRFIAAKPSDEKVTIKFDSAPTIATIYYYELNEGERLGDEITGTESELPIYVLVTHSKAVGASGTYSFDTPEMPTGLLELKDETNMPANIEFVLKGIAFCATKNGNTEFTYLHVWAQDMELFTPEDHKGLSVKTAYNELKFNVTTKQAFLLGMPYVFKPGYRITLKADATYDGTNTLAAGSAYVILFGKVRKIK